MVTKSHFSSFILHLTGPGTASEKGGGEMEKVRMRFATFANVLLHYILLQSGIIIEL